MFEEIVYQPFMFNDDQIHEIIEQWNKYYLTIGFITGLECEPMNISESDMRKIHDCYCLMMTTRIVFDKMNGKKYL